MQPALKCGHTLLALTLKTVFQERPCAGEGKQIEHNPISGIKPTVDAHTGTAGHTAMLQRLEADGEIRQLGWKIRDKEAEIRRLRKSMDAEVNALAAKKSRAANNLAGATWEQSISSEMDAVTKGYDIKIRNAESQLASLRDQLQRAEAKKTARPPE